MSVGSDLNLYDSPQVCRGSPPDKTNLLSYQPTCLPRDGQTEGLIECPFAPWYVSTYIGDFTRSRSSQQWMAVEYLHFVP